MDRKELKQILKDHRDWLNGTGGSKADLNGADLSKANLSRADLSGADLRRANLSRADLSGANLRWADLSKADLSGANLSRANLRGADLSEVDLSEADLRGAYLREADLSRADLSRADLSGIDKARLSIVPEGELDVWKICRDGVLVKLRIPREAKRSNATGRKCRFRHCRGAGRGLRGTGA